MKIKQYIVLRHEISPAVATLGVGHGVLAAYLKWQDDPIVQTWVDPTTGPFYKVVCQARDLDEFMLVRKWGEHIVMTESSLDNLEISVVFKPFEWQKGSMFDSLKLYGG